MKKQIPLIGICLLGLLSCNDSIPPLTQSSHFSNESIVSRNSLAEKESLPVHSTVLFHAKGALDISTQLLTYSGVRWESEVPFSWNSAIDTTVYTALYPVYDDHTYSASNLYADGQLEDVLIAQDTLYKKQEIELTFKHLFSQLTFHAPPSIQQQMKEIRLTVPVTVTSISTESGIHTTEATEYTSVMLTNESGSYPFILPPLNNSQLTLQLVMEDCTQTIPIAPYTFESNHRYDCKLKTEAGIYTAEDLIAFSQLINQREYNGNKTWEDFGEIIGDDTVFYLMNDLTLTEEECKRLLPIGYHKSIPFNHIFEGNNHTLSHLTVPDKTTHSAVSSLYSALFGYISPKASVRNLHISNSSTVKSPECNTTGILSAVNYGMILNCSVTNSSLFSSVDNTMSGIICANNAGYIVNCFSQNCHLKTTNDTKGGGIVGNATGHILNCYTYNNTFTTKSSAAIGGIAGMSNINVPLILSNCWVYHANNYKYFGSIIGNARSATIQNAFYNQGTTYYRMANSSVSDTYKYNSLFQADEKPVATLLNEWIDNIGSREFPQILFKRWETDDNHIPRFKE